MTATELLAGLLPEESIPAIEITGVQVDSRQVRPGDLFVAVSGAAQDGRAYIPAAIERGAVAILGEDLPGIDGAVALEVPDVRRAVSTIAVRWHGIEELLATDRLQLIGITGTNGKTTTAYLVREILRAAGHKCALFGTIEYDLCGERLVSSLTTPGPLMLAEHLATAVRNGATHAVLEVSSHALSQQRVGALPFAAVAWTNLTQDHLDYHKDLEGYARAKALLLTLRKPGAFALLNRDDERVREAGQERDHVRWYGLQAGQGLLATGLRRQMQGTSFRLQLASGQSAPITLALPGDHNVSNALAAAGLAEALGIGPDAIAAGLLGCQAVPGRVQRIAGIEELDVFVDYAHTPDALQHVCKVLRELTRGRLIVVFGCGGERDASKRPLMGQAAATHAHVAIVTSDNPRGEDPQQIIHDVLSGLDDTQRIRTVAEPDRRTAIRVALGGAQRGDAVLVAGKGHEDYQLVDGERIAFDDAAVVREIAAELGLAGDS